MGSSVSWYRSPESLSKDAPSGALYGMLNLLHEPLNL